MKQLLLIITIGLLVSTTTSALVVSDVVVVGAWSAAPSWDVGVPVCGDSILIASGDIIEVAAQQDYSACGSPMVLIIDGTLRFPANGPKLKLPTGSTIIVNIGGLITAPGGGNGNKISIGTEWVWEKSDGDVNGFRCFGACGPLPINLLSFELVAVEQSVYAKWVTLEESNNDFFTLERSSDGSNFVNAAEINGVGTSNTRKEYETKDPQPLKGISYYRLRQTDFDGQYSFSETLSISIYDSGNLDVAIFPNPLLKGNNLTISVYGLVTNDEVVIELQNISSQAFLIQLFVANVDGTQTFTLDTAGNLKPGLFLLKVNAADKISTSKLIVY